MWLKLQSDAALAATIVSKNAAAAVPVVGLAAAVPRGGTQAAPFRLPASPLEVLLAVVRATAAIGPTPAARFQTVGWWAVLRWFWTLDTGPGGHTELTADSDEVRNHHRTAFSEAMGLASALLLGERLLAAGAPAGPPAAPPPSAPAAASPAPSPVGDDGDAPLGGAKDLRTVPAEVIAAADAERLATFASLDLGTVSRRRDLKLVPGHTVDFEGVSVRLRHDGREFEVSVGLLGAVADGIRSDPRDPERALRSVEAVREERGPEVPDDGDAGHRGVMASDGCVLSVRRL